MTEEATKLADVKSFAARVITLETEKKTLTEDIKAVYDEAKKDGIDKKALKEAIKIKRTEVDLSHMSKVNTYLEALGEYPVFADR